MPGLKDDVIEGNLRVMGHGKENEKKGTLRKEEHVQKANPLTESLSRTFHLELYPNYNARCRVHTLIIGLLILLNAPTH